jgi:hypothetical protein
MPWQCVNCGSETSRSLSSYDEENRLKSELCPSCAPEKFEGAVVTPSDQKIWPGEVAMPNLYSRDREGNYHAKDELLADTVAMWDKGETERRMDKKRATRRTEPMTQAEIDRSMRWGREVLAPIIHNRDA